MPETVFGLPLHPLVVHGTVVLVPLTALLVALAAVLPRVRAWAGPLPLVMAAGCVVMAQLSTSSGATLQRVRPAVQEHAELGEMLIWWALGLLAVAAASYALRRTGRDRVPGVAVALVVLGVVVPVGAVVQTALIGHSGAESVWTDVGRQLEG